LLLEIDLLNMLCNLTYTSCGSEKLHGGNSSKFDARRIEFDERRETAFPTLMFDIRLSAGVGVLSGCAKCCSLCRSVF